MSSRLIPVILLLFSSQLFAQIQDAPPPPEMTVEEMEQAELLEPEVTIIRNQQETITEYRVNGILRMVKITPNNGFPYYLYDNDGDGVLETSGEELDEAGMLNQWLLLSW